MITTAKPFKLRFSIRALLVVMTLLALFLGYHLSWIHQRRAALNSVGVHAEMSGDSFYPPPAPGLLWLFGEQGYQNVYIEVEDSARKTEHMRELFPESDVVEPISFFKIP